MLGHFNTGCHGGKPFIWSVTERGLNKWRRVDGQDDPRQPREVDRIAKEQAKR